MTKDPKNTINGNCPNWLYAGWGGGKCALDNHPCYNVWDCIKMRSNVKFGGRTNEV
jgi:hypothetical protein